MSSTCDGTGGIYCPGRQRVLELVHAFVPQTLAQLAMAANPCAGLPSGPACPSGIIPMVRFERQ